MKRLDAAKSWGPALIALLLLSPGARADFETYPQSYEPRGAFDVGAGPGQPDPRAAHYAQAFHTAASQLGAVWSVDFGKVPAGYSGPEQVASGVAMTLAGTDTHPPAGYTFGVTDDHPDAQSGYGVTSSDGRFLRLVPDSSSPAVTTATMTLSFAKPIDALGLYVTGLGTAQGQLSIKIYDDGPANPRVVTLPGSTAGGIEFFGFTEPLAQISKVEVSMTGFSQLSRDIVGLDGISYGYFSGNGVPEPSSIALLGVALATLLGRRCWARSRGGRG